MGGGAKLGKRRGVKSRKEGVLEWVVVEREGAVIV